MDEVDKRFVVAARTKFAIEAWVDARSMDVEPVAETLAEKRLLMLQLTMLVRSGVLETAERLSQANRLCPFAWVLVRLEHNVFQTDLLVVRWKLALARTRPPMRRVLDVEAIDMSALLLAVVQILVGSLRRLDAALVAFRVGRSTAAAINDLMCQQIENAFGIWLRSQRLIHRCLPYTEEF